MINLNTITKSEFADFLLCNDDVEEFYYPRESKILSLDFDFEELKEEFEAWLIINSDN